MKVEYVRGPGLETKSFSFGSRILTENLLRNDKLDVSFNLTPLTNEVRATKELNSTIKYKVEKAYPNLNNDIWYASARAIISAYKYTDIIKDNIKEDYVLYSAYLGLFDIPTIIKILETGARVIVGGPTVQIYGIDKYRQAMEDLGCKYMHNIIFVSGYVDLTTDIYPIIKKWKDHVVIENDFSTFWDCTRDYIQDSLGIFQRMLKDEGYHSLTLGKTPVWESTRVCVTTDNICFWGKCKFCYFSKMKKCSYVQNTTPQKVAKAIIESCKLYKTYNIFLANDYFVFDEFCEELVKILSGNGINIGIYTGINLLKNVNYVKKVNKYIKAIFIGVESLCNFSLDYVNKGYHRKQVYEAVDNIIKYCNRDIKATCLYIHDLPIQNKQDVFDNIYHMSNIREKLRDAGFCTTISSQTLEIGWQLKDQFIDNKYVKEVTHDDKHISGRYLLWKYFEELGIVDSRAYKHKATPFQRYGSDGKVIPSDLDLLSPDDFKSVECYKE